MSAQGLRDLCSPCYWGECLEKATYQCESRLCICRCKPRRPVSDSTNELIRKALARELRAVAYLDSTQTQVGLLRAAQLIEDGQI